jgi:sec-independent protein translocase protein TatA
VNFFTPGHMAIIAVVLIVLFGAKRLPDAARSLGKSMRIFKSEIREMQTENSGAPSIETPANPAVNPQPVQSQRVDPPPASEQGHSEARPA